MVPAEPYSLPDPMTMTAQWPVPRSWMKVTYGYYTAIEKHRAAVSVLRAEFYVVRNRQQGFPRTGQLLENLCKRNLC